MRAAPWAVGWVIAGLLIAAGLVTGAPPRTGAAVELQSGPVIIAVAGPQGALRLIAEGDCLRAGCPILELRVRRGGPEERIHLTVR
ncbi:MAG: hypothetical protein ACOC05_04360 [Oceanicaulis sp.]